MKRLSIVLIVTAVLLAAAPVAYAVSTYAYSASIMVRNTTSEDMENITVVVPMNGRGLIDNHFARSEGHLLAVNDQFVTHWLGRDSDGGQRRRCSRSTQNSECLLQVIPSQLVNLDDRPSSRPAPNQFTAISLLVS